MELEASIAAVKDALLADERVSAAILFGSAAKGVARASSDLDVHLVLLDFSEPVLGRQAFLGGRVLFDRDPARTAGVLERILVEYFDGEYHRRMRAGALERRRESRRG